MGLKTTNYVSKSTGLVLPEAYARIKDLVLNGNMGRAIFAIHTSRANIDKFSPVDKVEVQFTWDRKTDIAEAAYNAAKTETRTIEVYNEKTQTVEPVIEYGTLYGWDNDIVSNGVQE